MLIMLQYGCGAARLWRMCFRLSYWERVESQTRYIMPSKRTRQVCSVRTVSRVHTFRKARNVILSGRPDFDVADHGRAHHLGLRLSASVLISNVEVSRASSRGSYGQGRVPLLLKNKNLIHERHYLAA